MSTKLSKIAADFTTSLAAAMAVGATTATLQSATDDDGVVLATGLYYLTIDGTNSQKEHIQCTLTGTAITSIFSVSRQGVLTSGCVRSHRTGSPVALTDFAALKYITDLLTGTTNLDSTTPLGYDGTASITTANQLATKAYVDGVAVAGAPNANTTTKGIVQEATQAQVLAKTAAGSTAAELYVNPSTLASTLLSDYKVDTGAANAYVITPAPAITAYTVGQIFSFKAVNANTLASTLNVNALGVKTIKKASGNDLVAGDIVAGQIVTVEYDATNFQLLSNVSPDGASKTGVQNQSYTYAVDSVGTDSYAVTLSPAVTSYVQGLVVTFQAGTLNTGAATLNVNGLGAKTIKAAGVDLVTGNILAGQQCVVVYDGTNFQLISAKASGSVSATGNVTPISSTVAGNNDETITIGFQPTNIQIFYFVQGHTASAGTNLVTNQKGIVVYSGATLIGNYIHSGALLTSGVIDTTNANAGSIAESGADGTAQGQAYGSIIVLSVSSTGFVVRKRVNNNITTPNTALVQAMYIAYN